MRRPPRRYKWASTSDARAGVTAVVLGEAAGGKGVDYGTTTVTLYSATASAGPTQSDRVNLAVVVHTLDEELQQAGLLGYAVPTTATDLG
jgi:hypothetical protein